MATKRKYVHERVTRKKKGAKYRSLKTKSGHVIRIEVPKKPYSRPSKVHSILHPKKGKKKK